MKKEGKKLDVEKEYKETIERFVNKKESKQPEQHASHVLERAERVEQQQTEKKPERKIKKIIYEDDEDENEDENKKFSYSNFTKKSAMEQMKDKINEDRLKFLYQKYILR